MKNKRLIRIAKVVTAVNAAILVLLLTAASSRVAYRGIFVGNGTGLTNDSGKSFIATTGSGKAMDDASVERIFVSDEVAVTNGATYSSIQLGSVTLAKSTEPYLNLTETASSSTVTVTMGSNGLNFKMSLPLISGGGFLGDGGSLSNLNAGNLTNIMPVASLPVGLNSSNYVGTFSGDGSGLTGIVDTNFNANLYAASTNATIASSLAINGSDNQGIQLAVRVTGGQTNDAIQVQTAGNVLSWGISSGGIMSWGSAPVLTNTSVITNVTWSYLLITNNGVGYAIPLHELQP